MTHDAGASPWAQRPVGDPDAERTIAFRVPDPTPDSERTLAFDADPGPAASDPAHAPQPTPGIAPVRVPAGVDGDTAPDPRGTVEWELQAARLSNRPSTDLGLLVLRLLSLPLVLHGIGDALEFGRLADRLGGYGPLAAWPELAAGLVVAAQLGLPVLLAAGFATRAAALAQALVVGGLFALEVRAGAPLLDPATHTLSGEGLLAYAALALPLVLTGPGRVSLDHAATASGRERRIERRVAKRLGR